VYTIRSASGRRAVGGALGLLLGCATALRTAPAAAAEHWIDLDPTPAQVAMQWKEGSLEAVREVGRPFVRIHTDGAGHPSLAVIRGIAPKLDARRRFLKVVLRVEGMDHLGGIEVRASSDGLARSWYAMDVPLYADLEYNFVQDGTWATLTLPFGTAHTEGTPDRSAIDSFGLLVTDTGKRPVTVDLDGFALVDEPPRGVVSFTFDDGYAEHVAAARLLAKHGWRGTFYVIPDAIGKPAHLSSGQLRELGKLGEIAAHADPPFTEVPANDLVPMLRGIQDYLVARGYAAGAQHLAYPLGKQEPRRVRPTVDALFTTARLAGSGPETIPPADPHLLRAVNVIDTTPPEQVGAWAARARDDHEWLILMFHWFPEKAVKQTDYAWSNFERLVEAVAKTGVRVAPVGEVWQEIGPSPTTELARRAAGSSSAPASPAP
jgi:hypothetical protein